MHHHNQKLPGTKWQWPVIILILIIVAYLLWELFHMPGPVNTGGKVVDSTKVTTDTIQVTNPITTWPVDTAPPPVKPVKPTPPDTVIVKHHDSTVVKYDTTYTPRLCSDNGYNIGPCVIRIYKDGKLVGFAEKRHFFKNGK